MKIKLLPKDKRSCYIVPCPKCERILDIHEFHIVVGAIFCRCLDENGKLSEIKLEEE